MLEVGLVEKFAVVKMGGTARRGKEQATSHLKNIHLCTLLC